MTTRDQFLGRVRAAVGRAPGPVAPPPPLDEDLVRLCDSGPRLHEQFAVRAAGAGMTVEFTSGSALGGRIRAFIDGRGLRDVAADFSPGSLGATVAQSAGVALAADKESRFRSGACVTDVECAIAETGSIVVVSDAHHARSGCIIAPVHIAIVRASQVVPDLLDWLRLSAAAHQPTSAVIITGPSKTADIEGVLVTGVHGPGEVHIFMITDA